MQNGFFYLHSSDRSISRLRGGCLAFVMTIFIEIPVLNANSIGPDQTPRSVVSNLGLHCLQMSFYETLDLNGLTF